MKTEDNFSKRNPLCTESRSKAAAKDPSELLEVSNVTFAQLSTQVPTSRDRVEQQITISDLEDKLDNDLATTCYLDENGDYVMTC